MSRVENTRIVRITGSLDIRSVRKNGQLFRGESVLVWISRSAHEGDNLARVGIIAAKRCGNAVKRNRAKRRARGCIMDLRQLLEPGSSYLVKCHPAVLSEDYQILVNDMRNILSKV